MRSGLYHFVKYIGAFADTLFGIPVTVKQFQLDGLAVATVRLSDRFGPVYVWDMYDPPGVWNTIRTLFGTIIADTLYGTVVSVTENPGLISGFLLAQNFPNPFNSTTTIRFSLLGKSFVSLKIFDLLGREVATLADRDFGAGHYSLQWQAGQNSSGIYVYRLHTSGLSQARKMVYLR